MSSELLSLVVVARLGIFCWNRICYSITAFGIVYIICNKNSFVPHKCNKPYNLQVSRSLFFCCKFDVSYKMSIYIFFWNAIYMCYFLTLKIWVYVCMYESINLTWTAHGCMYSNFKLLDRFLQNLVRGCIFGHGDGNENEKIQISFFT